MGTSSGAYDLITRTRTSTHAWLITAL